MLRSFWVALLGIALLSLPSPVRAQGKNPVESSGRYRVELRLPPAGVYAGEEIDIEFRVTDTAKADPVLGAPGVIRARIKAAVTMPSMAGMPAIVPKIHSEGVPGDYGLVATYPHGGEYRIALSITPPGSESPFTVAFLIDVGDADARPKGRPVNAPYRLDVRSKPEKPTGQQPVDLALRVLERATGRPVTAFEIVHEQPMHLIVVREDLGAFFHEHPTRNEDGTFTHRFTFPSGGLWRVFGDVAPVGAGSQVLATTIKVNGPVPPRAPLTTVRGPVTDRELTLTFPTDRLPERTLFPWTFDLKDSAGMPITDLQPWLGAPAHLILISGDGETFVHSHPDESDPKNGTNGKLTFLVRFPRSGIFKGWLQCQRANEIRTLPFVVRVQGKAASR
ncbi:MAG: FixH family protein [Capsulimonadales bacterium]|nr:FixH family protein [Capsulimonadales bacterium]